MCMISMIYDHYRDPFPTGPFQPWNPETVPNTTPTNPNVTPNPIDWQQGAPPTLPWTPETFAELKEIIKRLDELDKKLGLANCEDPKKAEWMKKVEERLALLELKNQHPDAITEFTGEYRFLSNFYESCVTYDFVIYPTLEHAYQAAKTLNLEERQKIKECKTPGQAKRMGRTVTLRPDWEQIKVHVMDNLLTKKFSLYPLKEQLLATKDKELIEGNTWGDTYWGVCNGQGENKLGQLLMNLRNQLQAE